MGHNQFQIESFHTENHFPTSSHAKCDSFSHTGMRSLLIGLSLRGWLCDCEKEELDNLAPEHNVVFLVLGNKYLHPENTELFPLEQIESTLQDTSEAVFSQRLFLSDEYGRKARMIRTARIGYLNDRQLILGMLGPELPESRSRFDDHFGNLINSFRQALKETEPIVTQLKSNLENKAAAVIINRSNGHVVAFNDAIRRGLSKDERRLIGSDYGETKEKFLPFFANGKMILENIPDNSSDFSVILAEPSNFPPPQLDNEFEDFLNRTLHKTASIAAAAQHLHNTMAKEPGHPTTELLQILIEETKELDCYLRRQHLLTEFTNSKTEMVNPLAELHRAIDQIGSGNRSNNIIFQDTLTKMVRTKTHKEALFFLFDTVLRLHTRFSSHGHKSHIIIRNSDTNSGMVISISTQNGTSKNDPKCNEWWSYSERLAELLGCSLEHKLSSKRDTLNTMITLA